MPILFNKATNVAPDARNMPLKKHWFVTEFERIGVHLLGLI
jgi:hypothetical protein